jgi:hypothetical protein
MTLQRPARAERTYESEVARLDVLEHELRTPRVRLSSRSGATYCEQLVDAGLLVPVGERGAPVDFAPADTAYLPLVGPWRAVPRTTTADEFESLEAMQGGRRPWLA